MSIAKEKIVFFGTPEFSLPSLKVLLANNFNIVAVVTNPDEPVGRKQKMTPPPVKVFAEKHNIPVFQPEKLTDEIFAQLSASDCFVVVAYGKMIPKSFLGAAKYGIINVHPSLLPRWRGSSPLQFAILHGDNETGVTIMKIDEQMDHGPILAKHELRIKNDELQKITYRRLHDQLAEKGAELLVETLPKWFAEEITPVPQDDGKATFSKILRKDDGRINWSKPAEEIERMVRAFNPWPGTWTVWPYDSKIFRVKIEEADWVQDEPSEGSSGFVWSNGPDSLLVKTGRGSLVIKKLTIQGKGSVFAKDFVRGHPQFMGSCLI